ncbi:flavin-containing monooxygenase [Paenibacillus guangzhouensis]|uniref:flavin-containing monooxygenase n=1 Tax=Paenibacillus guangzhouensis TaxID=1473112 RepID=UPI001266C57E|nr:NAD(P)-binding domain-containing protein [Paenibacillus guangzhouensis]
MMEEIDILVIGGGQAGLAAGYYLKHTAKSFLIISKERRIGNVWRHRYDSLVLFTPRWFSALPGRRLEGDPNGFATKNEIADYMERYAESMSLPVQLNTEILGISKMGESFHIRTAAVEYIAKQVIIATGPFQKPFLPEIACQVPQSIFQTHTAAYTNPSILQEGPVLVVGAGNSGAQIAVELSKDRQVYLSANHALKFFPLQFLGQSIFWWFDRLGLLHSARDSKIGAFIRRQGDPIFGMELKRGIREGRIHLQPRTTGFHQDAVTFIDGSQVIVRNIIWATGFRSDYSYMHLPGALNDEGMPRHRRGVSPVTGLFYVGLPWQHERGSALIGGVGEDAKYIVKVMNAL